MAKYSNLLVMTFGAAQLSVDPQHPNQMKFTGVLVRLDEPSTKAPNGAEGHRILVPSAVAKKRLKTLVHMGLNYAPSLDAHAQKRKVGTITRAWIEGKDLHVEAIIWKHDFPEAEQDLKQPGLGMSMEIGDVQVEDQKADIWKLADFYFLGATVLWKKSAAYYKTQAIAAKADERSTMATKTNTKKKEALDPQKLVEIATAAAVKAVSGTLMPTIGRQTKLIASLAARQDKYDVLLASRTIETSNADEDDDEDIEAAADGEEEACDEPDMKAGKGKENDDEDDDDDEEEIDATVDKGDLEDMGEKSDDDDDDPGHMSKDAKNKGRKTTSEDELGKTVSSARLSAALKANKQLARDNAELKASVEKLRKTVKATSKQVTAAAKEQGRRSAVVIDVNTAGLLSKSGINPSELAASGQKLTVGEVDALLEASKLNLGTVERMQAKNNLLAAGLMEEGGVNRGLGIN